MSDEFAKTVTEAVALSRDIQPLLQGRDPGVIGGALADLLSLLIAGHHPDLREEILRLHVEAVRDLIKPSEQQIAEQRRASLFRFRQ